MARNRRGPALFRSRSTIADVEVAMNTSTGTGSVAMDETDRLIASNKVEGTAVYNRQGERLGSVYNFMVDKRSGQVAYAVMSFGGFLGMGDSYHPLPWKALAYDTNLGGYMVDLDNDKLKAGPSYAASASPTWDRTYSERIDRYYGVSPYWGDTARG
jgi:PRC-barrel domain